MKCISKNDGLTYDFFKVSWTKKGIRKSDYITYDEKYCFNEKEFEEHFYSPEESKQMDREKKLNELLK